MGWDPLKFRALNCQMAPSLSGSANVVMDKLPLPKVVVATGGLGRIIAEETDLIQEYNNSLTLEGLRIIYEKNKRNN